MVRNAMVRTAQALLLLLTLGSASAAAGWAKPLPAAAGVPAAAVDAAAVNAAATGAPLLRVPQDVATLTQALRLVANGAVIQLAAGSYPAPPAGFRISNARKSFTIRAAADGAAILDGGGQHPVLVLRNTARSRGGLIIFQGLVFRGGGGGSATTSPGVTVDQAAARFVRCRFENNAGAAGADGGGVKVRHGSDASFVGCSFTGNSSPVAGGAMMIGTSNVQVTRGAFVANRVNPPDHDPTSHGGAISVVDGNLQVSDALFQGNQAGWVGGAIYAIGTTTATPATPHTSVSVTRATFQANAIAPQPCCPPPGPATGGAIHVENQAMLTVTGSRFVDNQAQFGGAIDGLGAVVDVAGSTFQGNGGAVTGGSEAIGGGICVLAGGAPAGGGGTPPAGLTVSGSLLQGSHAGSGPVGNAGGCILAGGDQQDLYGLGGHAPRGTLDSDRLPVQISGTVFAACDVQQSVAAGGGQGGAINGALVALTLDGSLVLDSAAIGNGSGGGLFLATESAAQISRTVFAGNLADHSGGAIFAGSSSVQISGSSFIANRVGAEAGGPLDVSRGAALYFIPAVGGQPHVGPGDAAGVVAQTVFSQNAGLPLWDVDAGGAGPVNTVQYDGNEIFNTTYGGRVYVDTVADPGRSGLDVASLNALVIRRAGGPTTVKSTVPNQALATAPAAGSLAPIPPAGSPSARSAPFLAYAWTGGTATLNGVPLPLHDGLIEGVAPGSYTLIVDGVAVASATVTP
jgi:predicted outer membrane repeat protein